jgi:hypothetical protein
MQSIEICRAHEERHGRYWCWKSRSHVEREACRHKQPQCATFSNLSSWQRIPDTKRRGVRCKRRGNSAVHSESRESGRGSENAVHTLCGPLCTIDN